MSFGCRFGNYIVICSCLECPDCIEITKEYTDNDKLIEVGWAAMNCRFGFAPDGGFDLDCHESLIDRVEKEIQ